MDFGWSFMFSLVFRGSVETKLVHLVSQMPNPNAILVFDIVIFIVGFLSTLSKSFSSSYRLLQPILQKFHFDPIYIGGILHPNIQTFLTSVWFCFIHLKGSTC